MFWDKKLAHTIVETENGYQCSVCSRILYPEYQPKGEYCCGKHCYSESDLPFAEEKGNIPNFLQRKEELQMIGKKLKKEQEPVAYLHYNLISRMDRTGPVFSGYEELYDVRECI